MAEQFFTSPDENRDFALLVEGQKLFVWRDYLSSLSPVFRRVFYPEGAPFKQPEEGMVMEEKKLNEFVEFLSCVCPTPTFKKIDESNLALMLSYADEYLVAMLTERCAEFMTLQLEKETVEGEGLVDYLQLAIKYSLADQQKQLVPLVARLSIDQIKGAHEALLGAMLATVYQSKLLFTANSLSEAKAPLPVAGYTHQCSKCSCQYTRRVGHSSCDICPKAIASNKDAALPPCNRKAAGAEANASSCVCPYDAFSTDLLTKK